MFNKSTYILLAPSSKICRLFLKKIDNINCLALHINILSFSHIKLAPLSFYS